MVVTRHRKSGKLYNPRFKDASGKWIELTKVDIELMRKCVAEFDAQKESTP